MPLNFPWLIVSCLFDINAQAAAIRLETISRLKNRESGAPNLLPTSYANFLRGLQAKGARIESLEIDDAHKRKIALSQGFLASIARTAAILPC